jgi:EGF-like domain.
MLKQNLYLASVVLLLAGASSCIKDPCANTVCKNEGVCVQATCACPSGFEGVDCGQAWHEKFAGDWHADDTYTRDTTGEHFKYDIAIVGGTADSFILNGLIDTVNGIVCKRAAINVFTIQPKVVDSSISINTGKATLGNGVITGNYSFRYRTVLPTDTGNRNLDTTITIRTTWTR